MTNEWCIWRGWSKTGWGKQVYYFFSDHLGSTNVITDQNGNVMSETLYKAWGEVRYSAGSLPTDYTYTGQRSEMDDIGLMFYNARWPRSLRPRAAKRREGYDPELGRFAQADTIVPGAGNPAAYDRYAYVSNNPIKFNDPSGHGPCYDSSDKCAAYWAEFTDYARNLIGYNSQNAEENFLERINDPIQSEGTKYRQFGAFRGTHNVPGTQWEGLNRWHVSVDAGGNRSESVFPVMAGTVVFAGWDSGGFGNTVIIEHLVDGEYFYSVYAHLGYSKEDTTITVEPGDFVTPINEIGKVGNSSGSYPNGCTKSTCPDVHLHFEARTTSNVDLSHTNPLNGQRYWAYEGEVWSNFFLDLGKVYGYFGGDPAFIELWGLGE